MTDSFSDDFDTRTKVAKEIANACEKVGFFYIKNHGIPQELIDDTLAAAKTYFSKPLEDKMKEHIFQEQGPERL